MTFRTKDSLDDFLLRIKSKKSLSVSKIQFQLDQHLDHSNKGCHLNNLVILEIINYVQSLDPVFFQLIALSVMPNHIHILFKQNKELPEIMQRLKGGLSFKVNKLIDKSGQLWEEDYFDKAIRDEKHFIKTYEYIKNNAEKAGLLDAVDRFYGVYDK